MIIRDFHAVGIAVLPHEADPPLIVDADAILTFAITLQLLQSIPGWYPQVLQRFGSIEDEKLPQGGRPDLFRKPPWPPTPE
jgi:hypothetical protein